MYIIALGYHLCQITLIKKKRNDYLTFFCTLLGQICQPISCYEIKNFGSFAWIKNLEASIIIITMMIVYNFPPKGRWIVVDIYRDVKRQGIYPPLFTDPEGDSCFSIYQIRWIKKCFFDFFFWNFRETMRHFSLRSQNSEYRMIFRVTGANQNVRKLLSTDLVNTNKQ